MGSSSRFSIRSLNSRLGTAAYSRISAPSTLKVQIRHRDPRRFAAASARSPGRGWARYPPPRPPPPATTVPPRHASGVRRAFLPDPRRDTLSGSGAYGKPEASRAGLWPPCEEEVTSTTRQGITPGRVPHHRPRAGPQTTITSGIVEGVVGNAQLHVARVDSTWNRRGLRSRVRATMFTGDPVVPVAGHRRGRRSCHPRTRAASLLSLRARGIPLR